MHRFFLDASALVKRYAPELGSPLIDHLFNVAGRSRLMCLMLGAAETLASLNRKRNRGVLTPTVYGQAVLNLGAEVLRPRLFRKLAASNRLVHQSLALLDRHAINATDAVLLCAALEVALDLRSAGDNLAVVTADHRLLRAAQAEGLATFNPETQSQADLDSLLVS